MPNIKSAKKRVRSNAKKEKVNTYITSSMRTAIKKTKAEVKNGNKEQATLCMKDAVKKIDKAVSSGLVHKNKAARDKSKLMISVNEIK